MMDTAMLNENVQLCGSCMEKIKDACSLECGHTICIDCLVLFTRRRPSAIKAKSIVCPTCRAMTKVPHPDRPIEDWPNQLKPDSEAQDSLDDIYEAVDAPGASSVINENQELTPSSKCEKHNSDIEFCCQDCNETICAKCSMLYHKECETVVHLESMTNVLRTTTKAISTLKGSNMEEGDQEPPLNLCKKHNADIEFYCQDSNEALCTECLSSDHEYCDNVVSLESMVPEMRTTVTKTMATIRSTLHDLKGNVELVESDIKRTNEVKALLEMKIENISHHAMQIIQRKEKMLQDELENTARRTVEQLKEEIVITESRMQKYQSELEHMTKAFESGSKLDLYQLYQLSKGLKCDVDIVSPALAMHLVNELKISEFEDSFELCTLKSVLVQTINTKSKDDLYQDIFDVVVLYFNKRDAIVVTDCYNKAVIVIYNEDSVQKIAKLRFQVKPLSLSKLNERQVVVCCQTKKEFALVNVFPELNIQVKRATLKQYSCLTVLGPNRLIGACEYPPSVDIIDLSGSVLQNVCTAETGLSTIMREPWFISTTNNGNIVLTDKNSQFGITALDRDGKVLLKKMIGQKDGTSGITPGQLQGVIVADLFNHRVLELTETGEINRELLTHSDGLQSPYGVCMHRGKLYVAEGEHGVKVFGFKAELAEFSIEDDHVYDEIA